MKITTASSYLLAFVCGGTINYSEAAHPLVTDDTGTQGQANSQIEINIDRAKDADGRKHQPAAFIYTYGVKNELDIFGNLPGTLSSPSEVNDASLGLKWRFWQHERTSAALRPELILPTGNENADRGNGRAGTAMTLLASHDAAPWSFHGNAGIAAQGHRIASARESRHRYIWSASAAATFAVSPRWTVVADTGIARASEKARRGNPAFFLLGAIYSPHDNLHLDAGMKAGLNKAEVRKQFGAGITLGF